MFIEKVIIFIIGSKIFCYVIQKKYCWHK